jgi:transcriptional regulator with XRE-family HTH domain
MRLDNLQFAKDIMTKRLIEDKQSMKECCELIGTSPATLSRIERGAMPELITYANICKWLNKDLTTYIKE